MKRTAYQIVFPITLVFMMVAFFSTFILADAGLSLAASGKKKSPVAVPTSAFDYTEANIKHLEGALKITSQEALWNNMTQVMRENAKEMDALTKEMAEGSKAMNAVERMKFHSRITEAHLNQQKKLIPIFETLYASMSDEQKKRTDALFEKGIIREPKKK